MSQLSNRLPNFSSIISVFGVISFPIYTWTFIAWLWKLPSWFLFLTPLEIMALFAYAMTTALVESLLVCGLVLFVSVLLPRRLFRDAFLVRGFWMAIGLHLLFLGYGGWWVAYVSTGYDLPLVPLPVWTVSGVIVTLLLVLLSTRLRYMAVIANWLSDRLIVFLYFQIPVSILSVLVVVFRNIF